MPKILIVSFFYAIGAACNALAAGLDAMPEDDHISTPPDPTIPAPLTPIEGESYASLRARGGAQVFGPSGEIGAGFIFAGGGWSPGV